jgi:hypothetical protein
MDAPPEVQDVGPASFDLLGDAGAFGHVFSPYDNSE